MVEGDAGSSARQEYQRRRAAEPLRRRRVVVIVLKSASAGAVAGGFVLLGWTGLNTALAHPFGRLGELGALAREAAVAVGLTATSWSAVRSLRPNKETDAWRAGARGEEATAAALAPLLDEGWHLLHDRRLPKSTANIDHIAVGPAGVWVIETKAWRGRVSIGLDRLRRNGQVADAVFDQLWRQTDAVSAAAEPVLGPRPSTVRPILCLPLATIVHGRDGSGRLVASGVEVHHPDALLRRLRLAEARLDARQVEEVAALIDRALPPARSVDRAGDHAGEALDSASAPAPHAPPAMRPPNANAGGSTTA